MTPNLTPRPDARGERPPDEPQVLCGSPPTALGMQVGGDHYLKYPIQPSKFIMANGIPWAEGAIIEYLVRYRDKDGVKDLRKARHLLDMLIEHEEAK